MRARTALILLLGAALLLAAGLVVTALLAGRSLRERDDAVRQGLVVRLGHELEATLRETDPAAFDEAVTAFFRAHSDDLAGVRVTAPDGPIEVGTVGDDAVEVQLFLGPGWRGAAMRGGGPPESGRTARGPGGAGRGGPPVARLAPAPGLGGAGRLASGVELGAIAAALAVIGLAAVAGRGLVQSERLAQVEAEQRRLQAVALAGAGLAHRIRNPLGAIKGTAQLLAGAAAPPERARAARIVDASERIEGLVSRLLDFARPPQPHPSRLDLGLLAAEVAERARPPVKAAGSGVVAFADRENVESIIEELLANARAFDPDGELEVDVRRDGAAAVVEVRDHGPGPGGDVERLFDPYVTTRPEGTGLGLAIVRALANANRGEVTLAAGVGGGTVARLRLPGAEG